MNLDKKQYQKYVEKRARKSGVAKNCLKAFVVGGAICAFGQALFFGYYALGSEEDTAKTLVSITVILFAVILTALGIFDDIARFAGAGTLVPICGFANAVVSPALDNKAEGWVLGVGAKIFTVAGPVILYGTIASVLYGIVYYLSGLVQ